MDSRPLPPLRAKGSAVRVRTGKRTHSACVNCKDRKVRCDGQVPACGGCLRLGLACFIQDPSTKRQRPRDYLEQLEQRVVLLEEQLREAKSSTAAARDCNSSWDASVDQPDEDDDLSSIIGTLSLNTAGSEPTFLGSSSAFAFSRFLKTSLQSSVTTPSPRTAIDYQALDASSQEPCSLPDYQTAVKLSNAYFDNVHTQYPFLHEESFRAWESRLADPSQTIYDSVSLFFLPMVYAIGATLLPHTGWSSEQLYASAMLFVDDVLRFDNLESIQAILLCTAYSLRSSAGTSQWKLSGQALRQCVDLGYHRDRKRIKKTQPLFQQEMQKRVFWSAYIMECAASNVLGRPLSLRFQDIDVELPLDIEESQLTLFGLNGSPRIDPNQPSTMMTYAIHGIKIRVLLGRIQSELYSECNLTASDKRRREEMLSAALEQWRAETPPPRLSPRGGALSMFMTADSFSVNYNHALLSLHRLRITDKKNTAPDDIFLACLRASRATCQAFRRQLIGKQTAYTWSIVHELFLAGLTYLYCLWMSPACRATSRYDEVSGTCTDCTVVLVVSGERWTAAAPFRDIFEVLSSRTVTMMADMQQQQQQKQHGTQTGTGTQPAPMNMNVTGQETFPPDLEQWIAGISDLGSMSSTEWFLNELVEDFTGPAVDNADVGQARGPFVYE